MAGGAADSREVAFATAHAYASYAESRGAWDARLEALVVDALVRGVHPNTVRYRLHRIADLTGRDPWNPRDLLVLQTAVILASLPNLHDPLVNPALVVRGFLQKIPQDLVPTDTSDRPTIVFG